MSIEHKEIITEKIGKKWIAKTSAKMTSTLWADVEQAGNSEKEAIDKLKKFLRS